MPRRQPRATTPRKVASRQNCEAKLIPYLAALRENLGRPGLVITVQSVAKAIGVAKQTLYNHGLDSRITALAQEHQSATGRIRRARPGAQQRIAALSAEVEKWKAKYDSVLDMHTRLLSALRIHATIDLEAVLATPLPKPNRSQPATARKRSHSSAE